MVGTQSNEEGPKIVYGVSQGALITVGYSRPAVVEKALSTQNIQREESKSISAAYGNVAVCIGRIPRAFSSQSYLELLEPALPEMFPNKKLPLNQYELSAQRAPRNALL